MPEKTVHHLTKWYDWQGGAIRNVLRLRKAALRKRVKRGEQMTRAEMDAHMQARWRMRGVLIATDFDEFGSEFREQTGEVLGELLLLRVIGYVARKSPLLGEIKCTRESFGRVVLSNANKRISKRVGERFWDFLLDIGALAEGPAQPPTWAAEALDVSEFVEQLTRVRNASGPRSAPGSSPTSGPRSGPQSGPGSGHESAPRSPPGCGPGSSRARVGGHGGHGSMIPPPRPPVAGGPAAGGDAAPPPEGGRFAALPLPEQWRRLTRWADLNADESRSDFAPIASRIRQLGAQGRLRRKAPPDEPGTAGDGHLYAATELAKLGERIANAAGPDALFTPLIARPLAEGV